MRNVLIIIPVHNEADNLPALIPRIQVAADKIQADIVAINDASTDRSDQILAKHAIRTLTHPCQMGYGVTIQTGYKYALKHQYQYLLQIDGDGQHDPRCLSFLLDELRADQGDVVIGSRFLAKENIPFQPEHPLYYGTPVRRLGISLFRFTLFCLSLRSISDPTSGFIGFNQKALDFICGRCFPFDYPDADFVLTLLKNGFRVKETPVFMYPKEKKFSLHRGCRPLWYIVKMSIALGIAFIRRREIPHG